MTFADTQLELGLVGKRFFEPKVIRDKNLCPKCAKQGRKVKLRLARDGYTQENYTKYKFEFWVCDVCRSVDKRMFRIEGKGKNGFNSGKVWGGV